MKPGRWRLRAAGAGLVLGLLAGIPLLILLLGLPPALLAACGDYYSSSDCGGCGSGSQRPLCCVLVRQKFQPRCTSPEDGCVTQPDNVDCCGLSASMCCHLTSPEDPCNDLNGICGSRGISAFTVTGTPRGDGTTGVGASPKYKSNQQETVTFVGFVRICAGNSGNASESWICAAGRAEVSLDGQPHNFLPDCDLMGASNYYCDSCEDGNTS